MSVELGHGPSVTPNWRHGTVFQSTHGIIASRVVFDVAV